MVWVRGFIATGYMPHVIDVTWGEAKAALAEARAPAFTTSTALALAAAAWTNTTGRF